MQHGRATAAHISEGWLGERSWGSVDPLEEAPEHTGVCTGVSLVGVQPFHYTFWKYFVLLDSSSTTGGTVLGYFHAAGTVPALRMSVPLDLQEQSIVKSRLQAVTCFHSVLKIMLFVPFLCVGTSKGSYGSHCCSIWDLLSVLKACMETGGYGGYLVCPSLSSLCP